MSVKRTIADGCSGVILTGNDLDLVRELVALAAAQAQAQVAAFDLAGADGEQWPLIRARERKRALAELLRGLVGGA